jgi:hypothetical protein
MRRYPATDEAPPSDRRRNWGVTSDASWDWKVNIVELNQELLVNCLFGLVCSGCCTPKENGFLAATPSWQDAARVPRACSLLRPLRKRKKRNHETLERKSVCTCNCIEAISESVTDAADPPSVEQWVRQHAPSYSKLGKSH